MLQEEILLLIYFICIIFLFSLIIVVFFIAFQRRKNILLKEKYEADQRYQKELISSQIEIQEQTLKNIAWELHDNVGQLLSVANMQLNVLMRKLPHDFQEQVTETKNLLGQTVQEVRSLSKVLNNDVVLKNGIVTSLQVELDRYQRLGYLETSLEVDGEEIAINSSSEIILFRILQEFLSNVLKHSQATKLSLFLEYKENTVQIVAADDGVGFDVQQKTDSSGMETMRKRAELLKASYKLESEIGKGTKLTLKFDCDNGKE